MEATHPKSIFQLLTHPNPTTTDRQLNSYGNSSYQGWSAPQQLVKWADFQDLAILKQAFNGRLYEEACRERQGFRCFPEIFDQELTINSETEVRDLIVRWSKGIVLAGHKPIAEEFRPLLWAKGDRLNARNVMSPISPPKPTSVMAAREATLPAIKRLRTSQGSQGRVGIQDSGAISPNTNDSESGNTPRIRQERFPMEFKVGAKWKSECLKSMLDKNGAWMGKSRKSNLAMPIRQAFSYCVDNLCRYGCIFTDKELFLFQISSLDGKPGNAEDLKEHIKRNGKIEYVVIPYETHCLENFEAFNTWTINLAIWFMFIQAAQSHELGWSYLSLTDSSMGSTDCEGSPEMDEETSKESNDIAGQDVEEPEEGEVDKDGSGVGAVSGSDDSDRAISGSESSKGTSVGSEDSDRTRLDSKVSGTKPKRGQRRPKKRKYKG